MGGASVFGVLGLIEVALAGKHRAKTARSASRRYNFLHLEPAWRSWLDLGGAIGPQGTKKLMQIHLAIPGRDSQKSQAGLYMILETRIQSPKNRMIVPHVAVDSIALSSHLSFIMISPISLRFN